ncbi:drtgg [Lucifera butyrica]|uniref:Drtgg n=1 Tax=Lucifera butyrica TaxID=1351585 RepID=A0A498R640_9FIRM|nr:DRTGG domain-containing protein [Lucifera butyrica]VBB06320.1 drtgg [Lucifera butyrica]
MKLSEVKRFLSADVICGDEWLEQEAACACGADLMSDVLAFTKERTVLLTGLTNIQVIRTAEVSDLVGIVFVRGKRPGQELIQLAQTKGIPLFVTEYPMYEACGRLYKNGLQGCFQRVMVHAT